LSALLADTGEPPEALITLRLVRWCSKPQGIIHDVYGDPNTLFGG
jgi:hypothetical protein